ncbi:MAG TPA: DUF2306 domain-containing protein [Clostridia bacterium]|nr:DUF2306 domain-containing protein [Clostridia bacterium]
MATVGLPSAGKRYFSAKSTMFAVLGVMLLVTIFTRDLALLDPDSPLRQRYAAIPGWMLMHGIFGAIALFAAPFQFSNRLRQRHLKLHRITGRVYVACVAISAPTSVVVAAKLGPPELFMAAVSQSLGWIVTTATAVYCIRMGNIQQHREWMIRSYPFAAVFLVVRAILPIPPIAALGVLGLIEVVWTSIVAAAFLPSFFLAWRGLLADRRKAKVKAVGVS